MPTFPSVNGIWVFQRKIKNKNVTFCLPIRSFTAFDHTGQDELRVDARSFLEFTGEGFDRVSLAVGQRQHRVLSGLLQKHLHSIGTVQKNVTSF